MDPKFSIIIPTYNRKLILKRAIESVLEQSINDFEIIVVDDGSTDDTSELMNTFSGVKYQYQENKGVSAARNTGAKLAVGEWLLFLDSDDVLFPDALENFQDAVENGNFHIIMSGVKIIADSVVIKTPILGQYVPPIPGTFLIRRILFLEAKGYDEYLKFSENTELLHRLSLGKGKIKNLLIPTIKYFPNPTARKYKYHLENKIYSLKRILEKHDDSLTDRVKYLYLRIIGVSCLRIGDFNLARKSFLKAIRLKPASFSTWIRLLVAYIPNLSKKLYPVIDGK